MNKPMAVLVPTRSRPHNVEAIRRAWWETGAFGFADLIFVVDADDMKLHEYRAEIEKEPAAQVVVRQEWQPLVPKLNAVAKLAARDYHVVAFMGDDHLPRTPGWAGALMADHMLGRSRMIVYGRDGFQDERLPTWWSMHSEVITTLGRMVPADVQHLYCDNAVKALGEQAGVLYYDPEILVEHMHPIVGKAQMDAQYQRVNRMQQYDRDRAAFDAWVADGLARDATMLRGGQ